MLHGLLGVFLEYRDPILLQYIAGIIIIKEFEEMAAEILRVRNEY